MNCGCCIEIDTPQSIYDEGNDYYEAETDIFEEVFDTADVDLDNEEVMRLALWSVFRLRMLVSCDTQEWVRIMADRLNIVGPKWDAIITKESTIDLSDLKELHYERTIQRTAIEGTNGDERTISHTGHDTDMMERENLPENLTTDTKYLSGRDTRTFTPGVTDTDKFKPNTQDKETYDEERELAAVTFAAMMDAYPEILLGFANEFEPYFMVIL